LTVRVRKTIAGLLDLAIMTAFVLVVLRAERREQQRELVRRAP